ncbi:MAG: DUF1850 domain-containing protein [Geminicoccaceae bacterium]|nr:DUF1850 domain-containing protein [Geminicoccaceae bacterium]
MHAGALVFALEIQTFTLSWVHSVEKTRWEEDWRAEGDALVLVESRVQTSGAGMEPGPEARLEQGFWRSRPSLPPQRELLLARSPFAEDWRLCAEPRGCLSVEELLSRAEAFAPLVLRPCTGAQGTGSNQSGQL